MRIVEIRELPVKLQGKMSNAVVSFTDHTVSLVAVISDVIRGGKPVAGIAFNSIGRYAQSGIIRDRMIPRILAAEPASLLDKSGDHLDPAKVLATALRNEKPGGHGDRAAAASGIELACWDLNARLTHEPACATIARHFGHSTATRSVPVYAAGGYYRTGNALQALRDEIKSYQDLGYDAFKMKIGGAPLREDLARVTTALEQINGGQRLAVDANGRFDRKMALDYARELAPLDLRWYEEPVDPLDFDTVAELTHAYPGALATGENLFSSQDVTNLLRYGKLRPGKDLLQMDAGLSYGLTEYVRMLDVLAAHGIDRRFAIPHGGHLINLHIVVALGLGGCEAYPGEFQPFGGYSPDCKIENGHISPADHPGFGLEHKPDLRPFVEELLA
jgi:L-alanine-DL-glutamate epimerase-like enolase superfamily enzyme